MSTWLMRLGKRADAIDAITQAPLEPPTRDNYRRWLSDIYGYLVAFEAKFAFAASIELAFIQKRIRSGLIASDLLALGLDAGEFTRLAQRCSVPDFEHPLDALGWLLVVERIVSQGSPLRKRLQMYIPRELATAGSFLRTYENVALERSAELNGVLARWVALDTDVHRLNAALAAAMTAYEAWMAGAEAISSVEVSVRSA
jgi:heme oxygenase